MFDMNNPTQPSPTQPFAGIQMSRQSLNIIYNNINSFIPKKHLINNFIENNDIDCALFVETKIKKEVAVKYRNWNIVQIHGNVINNARGGSLALLKHNFKMRKENAPITNNRLNEALHFSIPFMDNHLHVFLLYIHPLYNIDDTILTKARMFKYAIIIGDFNLNRTKSKQLKTFLFNSDFKKILTEPTFLMPNNTDSTPDLILHTNNLTNNFTEVKLVTDLGSDHLGIKIKFNMLQTPIAEPTRIVKYLYDRCNMTTINERHSNYVKQREDEPVTEQAVNSFYKYLQNTILENTPNKGTTILCT